MKVFERAVRAICICLMAITLIGTSPSKSTTAPTTRESIVWKKVTSSSSMAKSTPKFVKFQPTARFRVHFSGGPAAESGPSASAASIRIALMQATAVDMNGVPATWQQVELLAQTGDDFAGMREFNDGGLDRNGQVQWFAVQITGQAAHYQVVIEQAAASGKSSSSSRK